MLYALLVTVTLSQYMSKEKPGVFYHKKYSNYEVNQYKDAPERRSTAHKVCKDWKSLNYKRLRRIKRRNKERRMAEKEKRRAEKGE